MILSSFSSTFCLVKMFLVQDSLREALPTLPLMRLTTRDQAVVGAIYVVKLLWFAYRTGTIYVFVGAMSPMQIAIEILQTLTKFCWTCSVAVMAIFALSISSFPLPYSAENRMGVFRSRRVVVLFPKDTHVVISLINDRNQFREKVAKFNRIFSTMIFVMFCRPFFNTLRSTYHFSTPSTDDYIRYDRLALIPLNLVDSYTLCWLGAQVENRARQSERQLAWINVAHVPPETVFRAELVLAFDEQLDTLKMWDCFVLNSRLMFAFLSSAISLIAILLPLDPSILHALKVSNYLLNWKEPPS